MASSSPNCSTNRCVSCVGLSDLIFFVIYTHCIYGDTEREIRNVEPHHLNEVTTKGVSIFQNYPSSEPHVFFKIPVGGGAPNLFVNFFFSPEKNIWRISFFFFLFGFCSTPPKKSPGICLYVVHTNKSHLFLSLTYLFRLALGKWEPSFGMTFALITDMSESWVLAWNPQHYSYEIAHSATSLTWKNVPFFIIDFLFFITTTTKYGNPAYRGRERENSIWCAFSVRQKRWTVYQAIFFFLFTNRL